MLKKLLEKSHSSINNEITIYSVFGSPKMNIGGLLQSGGVVADIWKKGVKTVTRSPSFGSDNSTRLIQPCSKPDPSAGRPLPVASILILGLGCGTAASVFSKKWPKAKIIGVEIDPEVIRLGKKYFGLGKIPNLKIVCSDAIKTISNHKLTISNFDHIIVDLYLGEKIPDKTESINYLKNLRRLLSKNGIIIFNRLFWGKHKKKAGEFVKKTEKVFTNILLVRTVANLLVIAKK